MSGLKKIAMPKGFKVDQKLVDKLAGMNREQRRAWAKKKTNRRSRVEV